MNKKLLTFFILILLSFSAIADDFEDGEEAYERGDYSTALILFKKTAEQGNAEAQINLGIMYVEGLGVEQDDSKAVKWFRKSAEQGNAEAQGLLGTLYENGLGVPQDYTEALKWYRKAAEQGNADSQREIGYLYAKGQGTRKNFIEAFAWFHIAAEVGDEKAQQYREMVIPHLSSIEYDEARKRADKFMSLYSKQ